MDRRIASVAAGNKFYFTSLALLNDVWALDQTSKRKYEKIFLRPLPLSRFLAKTLRAKKLLWKDSARII